MKMRKILPLVILAVGSVVLLSGCDMLLNAIFQNNQIFVDVRVSSFNYGADWTESYNFGVNSGRVTVYVVANSGSGSVTQASSYWTSADTLYVHYGFNFTGLKNDTYQVYAVYTSYYSGGGGPSTAQYVAPNDSTGGSANVTITY
jgi:hypothetical protein